LKKRRHFRLKLMLQQANPVYVLAQSSTGFGRLAGLTPHHQGATQTIL
jgi:hypothetical protein